MKPSAVWERLMRGARLVFQEPAWSHFAGSELTDNIMHIGVSDRYHAKQGRSTGRCVLENGNETLSFFLKRHYRLPWWQRLLATIWPGAGWSPALQEWRNLLWAKRHRIQVPEALAVGEFIGPRFRLKSFLVVAELTGMLPLHKLIPKAKQQLSPLAFEFWKRGLIKEMARLSGRLHRRNRYHKDLYLCHFFVRQDDICQARTLPSGGFRGRVYLIDFHRLAHHFVTAWHWQLKDLAQLLYSSDVPGVNDRDRLRFFHRYLRQRKLNRGGRFLLRLVVWKRNLYRRHNKKRALFRQASTDVVGHQTKIPA